MVFKVEKQIWLQASETVPHTTVWLVTYIVWLMLAWALDLSIKKKQIAYVTWPSNAS